MRATLCAALISVLSVAPCADAAGQWVLWVEAPLDSDNWSVAPVRQTRFTVKDECARRAADLNEVESTIAKMERATGDSRDRFACLPDTVDPRPEGAPR